MRFTITKAFVIIINITCLTMQDAKSQEMNIDLSGQNISALPDSIFDYADQIVELNLGSSGELFVATYPKIRPLPFGTGFRNKFKKISPKIGLMKNLKIIDFSFNNLKTLPIEFYSLPITELNLNFNYHFDLSGESFKLNKLKELKRLYLIGIKFNLLPEDILRLNLEELAIGNINLTVDDGFIERLSISSNLKALYLTDVNMQELPGNFDKLQFLEKLDIRYTLTKDIKKGVISLQKLKTLKVINFYGLPLTLEDIHFINDSLPGVEIEFLSN